MATQARLRANKRYEQRSVKRISVPFYPKDKELYEYACSFDNKAGYIRDLIEKDMQAKHEQHEA
ncbi:hypothetical protein ACNF5K_04265 [Fannyhessea vaginae]|uniref:hypothetical protein n=1 Tax=Fannyhessea vaginae TaxID=82135 RepID=UPI003A80F364